MNNNDRINSSSEKLPSMNQNHHLISYPPPPQHQQYDTNYPPPHPLPPLSSTSNTPNTYYNQSLYPPVITHQQQQLQHSSPFPPPPPVPYQYPAQQSPIIIQQQPTDQPSQGTKKRPHSSRATAAYPRKRALTACDTCRLKKIKCDNVRPRCGSCVRNGNASCHFKTDDFNDYSSYDPASLNILGKLDTILSEMKSIKKSEKTESCVWDLSITSILNWNSFIIEFGETPSNVQKVRRHLLHCYERNNFYENCDNYKLSTFHEKLDNFKHVEVFVIHNFSSLINSFFLNSYTKIPIFDIFEFFDILECLTFLSSTIENFSFMKLLELYDNDEKLPKLIHDIYKRHNKQTDSLLIAKFNKLVHCIPIILLMCALGLSSTTTQLENFTNFKSSIEESRSLSISCVKPDIENDIKLPRQRNQLSFHIMEYSEVLCSLFPFVLKPNTLLSTKYYILMNQLYLQHCSPLFALRNIVLASQNIMYYLEKTKNNFGYSNELRDRLFWICYKLESEICVEMSPVGSFSGILEIDPPTPFVKVPELNESELKLKYSDSVIKMASKYDDKYTWYYYLTEIAVRKIDNQLCNDLCNEDTPWDTATYHQETIWYDFIKYLNHYNGIINSLSSEIRNFVLHESDVGQIFKSIKSKTKNKSVIVEDDIFNCLDSFSIDDDVLIQNQSQSVMFIKTRIITSKLLLFRPIVYLIAEGKIKTEELLEAASSLFETGSTSMASHLDSPISINSSEHSTVNEIEIDYYNLINAPLFYQKQNPIEDFSNLIHYHTNDKNNFKIDDIKAARFKILQIYIQSMLSLPKLNIPKLGGYRHPGSWYFLRNTFIGNIYQYFSYKALQKSPSYTSSIPSPNNEKLIQMLVDRQTIIDGFEHTLILFDYWKDECRDCEVYQNYIRKMLNKL